MNLETAQTAFSYYLEDKESFRVHPTYIYTASKHAGEYVAYTRYM